VEPIGDGAADQREAAPSRQLDDAGDEDFFRFDLSYDQSARIASAAAPPANFQLSGDATFTVSIDDGPRVPVTVRAVRTTGAFDSSEANKSLADLVADINKSLDIAGLGDEGGSGS